MTEDLINENEELEETTDIEKAVEEVIEDDYLNVFINLDDIKDLTEEECDILSVKIEVAIDNCEDEMNLLIEDIPATPEKEAKFEELKNEFKRLKELDKLVHDQKKGMKKKTKEGGLFGNLPIWAFCLFIICALFTIVPVNPYFPIELYIDYAGMVDSSFIHSEAGAYFFYFAYVGIFVLIELVIFIILLIRGLKNREKMGTFKSYLAMFIVNIIIDIPGVVLFLRAVLR